MKTFPATHLNKHAKEVFAAAKEDGSVVIEHNGYFGGVFAIVWNPDEDKHPEYAVHQEVNFDEIDYIVVGHTESGLPICIKAEDRR